MTSYAWLFRCASFALMAQVVIQAGISIETLRNSTVAVYEDTLAPGQQEMLPGDKPSLTLYMQRGTLEITQSGGKPQRVEITAGESAFQAPGTRSLRNAGSFPLRLVRIDFLAKGSPEKWGHVGLPPHYKVVLDNDYARVYDIYIPSHTEEPQHTHKDRVVVCLSGAELMHHFPDGRTEISSMKTGEIAWRHGSTHIGENRDTTDFRAVAVEPK